MAFDTETTGFAPKVDRTNGKPPPTISEYPMILQLSFIIYDLTSQTVVQEYNQYVKIPEDAVIPAKATEVNGITKQICNLRGIPIEQVLEDFYRAYISVGRVVAHNLAFDRKMIEIEILRSGMSSDIAWICNDTWNDLNDVELVCTMTMPKSKDICNLYTTNEKTGTRWKKQPKLSELHFALFDFVPGNLHDALMDTKVCLRCYLKIACGIELPL